MVGETPRSIALICNAANRVHSVLHNPEGLPVKADESFIKLFDPGSRDKALLLLESIRARQAAFGWELHLHGRGESLLLQFCGASVPEGTLIVAAETQPYANALFSRMLQGTEAGFMPEESLSRRDTLKLHEQLAGMNNQLLSMQRELEKKNAELTRLLEDRARIAAMAAHDLRTPLQVILSGTAALKKLLGPQAAEPSARIIAMIGRNADAMRLLVKDLLSAHRADIDMLELSMQPFDLEALVCTTAQNHRPMAEQKELKLAFRSSGTVPQVLGDPLRIEQVLNNLVHNAIKFSVPGGAIDLDVSGTGSEAVVSVEDEGMGLKKEQLDALLRGTPGPSRPGSQGEAGFGLGFTIIRSIVERHGGTIEADSHPGKGARFSIRLPAHREASVG